MEPFALFNLLKSLLPQTDFNGEKPNQTQTDSATQSPPQNQAQSQTHTPVPPTADLPPAPLSNSFLDFAQRHDERAKRIKNKK